MKLKIEVRVPDDSKLLGGFQLLANLVNSGADDIIVPPGEKLARVRVKNREEAGVLLPLLPSEQRYMVSPHLEGLAAQPISLACS